MAFISPRIWGRVYSVTPTPENPVGTYTWQVVTPDANGNADYVYATNLCQALALNLGESPFYATVGIPGQRSVMQQLFPDFYANLIQQLFAPYFAALTITRQVPTVNAVGPVYNVSITRHNGSIFQSAIPL